MRRLLPVLLCAAELLLFTGRGGLRNNYREVEQLLVVQTMGLDAEDGRMTVSLAAEGDSERGPKLLRAGGVSVSAAMERIHSYSYEEELFCPHIGRLLLGEKAAEAGIENVLAYICRSPELRLDMPLFVVRGGTAEDAVMQVGGGQTGICEVMRTVEQSAKRRGESNLTTVAQVLRDTERGGSALICALDLSAASESEKGGEDEQKSSVSAAPLGYAILREGRLCRYLTAEQGVAAGLLRNRPGTAALQLRDSHGNTAVLEITGGSSRIRPVWDEGELTGLRVQTQVQAKLLELGGRGALKGTQDTDYLTAQLEAQLARYLRDTLQAEKDLRADFLCLAECVERADPAAFRKQGRSFPDLLPELELEISVSARLSQMNDMK